MNKKEDLYLINKVKKGNVSAFETLINKHKELVYTVAIQIVKNKEDAEELAQDAFIKAYNSINSFKGDSKFSTWLYRIVYNLSVSKIRKKKKNLINIDDIPISGASVSDTYENYSGLEKEERLAQLKQAINKLNEDEAFIITLFYMEGMSVKDISEITNLTDSNIKIKLHRARKKLFVSLGKINGH